MKQALIVGINGYPDAMKLHGCVADASGLADILKLNEDGTTNFEVMLKTELTTKEELRKSIITLFNRDTDVALFYFSGHGYIGDIGSYIVTPDFKPGEEGVSMEEILRYANESDIRNKIIILDCCHSGAFGAPINMLGGSYLRKGITILTASRDNESAVEINGSGVFTSLLINALKGGAADLKGDITPGSVYAYIDQAIGAWGQRPVFKANISRFIVLRTVTPPITIGYLRQVITLFPEPDYKFKLDPSYEWTSGEVIPENDTKFKVLQRMNRVGMVIPSNRENHDMYWAAMRGESCELTELGQHYWRLVNAKRI